MTDYAKKLKEYSEFNKEGTKTISVNVPHEKAQQFIEHDMVYFKKYLSRVHEHRQFDFMRKLIAESFAEELKERLKEATFRRGESVICEEINKLKVEY